MLVCIFLMFFCHILCVFTGGGASWHPGYLTHKLRGDSLAYTILSILHDAVESIDENVCTTDFGQGGSSAAGIVAAGGAVGGGLASAGENCLDE